MSLEKNALRQEFLRAREGLAKTDVDQKSALIIEKLVALNEYKKCNVIMCYVNFKNEVITQKLIIDSMAAGKKVVVPAVMHHSSEGGKEIIACEIKDFERDLEPGTFGILEPKKNKIGIIEPEKIDFIVVPGVVFDSSKNRIGYGAGYYDRFLSKTRRGCIKAGLAFEMQIASRIPAEEWDVSLDLIVTEERIIR